MLFGINKHMLMY